VEEIVFALARLTEYPEIRKVEVLSFKSLLMCLSYDYNRIQEHSIIAIGNLVNLDNNIANSLVDQGLISTLLSFLPKSKIVKSVCWIFSNLALCGEKSLSDMLSQDVYESMVSLIRGNDVGIVKEAIWVILNSMISGNKEQLEKLIEKGLVEELIGTLSMKDVNITYMVLDGLNKILNKLKSVNYLLLSTIEKLKKSSAGETIEQFLIHPNPKLSELALQILRNASTSVEPESELNQ